MRTTFGMKHLNLPVFLLVIFHIVALTGCSSEQSNVQDVPPGQPDHPIVVLPSPAPDTTSNTTPPQVSSDVPRVSKCGEGKCGDGKRGGAGKPGEGKCGLDKVFPPVRQGGDRIVPVYYGTDRKPVVPDADEKYYGSEPGDLKYGVARVHIPEGHKRGALERPKRLFFFDLSEDPSKHILITEPPEELSENEFFERLKQRVASAADNSVFVFIHGFNVSFEDSILRTGQLAWDLNIRGAAVAYSWPSNNNVVEYASDTRNNRVTIPHLQQFLTDIRDKTQSTNMHVLAHSMGNRAFTEALRNIARQYESPIFKQIILAAPDIDAEVFKAQIAPEIIDAADRITLYASSHDKALMTSTKLYGNYPRVGLAGEDIMIVDGIDTVDTSSINAGWLGLLTMDHSEYGDELIDDIFQIVRHGHTPEDRNLIRVDKQGRNYWAWPN